MKKSIFARITTMLLTVMTVAIVFSFSMVSTSASAASAAELPATTASVAEVTSLEAVPAGIAVSLADTASIRSASAVHIMPMAGTTAAPGGTATSSDETYKKVITFFIVWIRRIGVLVAFVGAIMFALAIKNNDAEQKQQGLLTLVAGFVAAAVCTAVDMFDLFS